MKTGTWVVAWLTASVFAAACSVPSGAGQQQPGEKAEVTGELRGGGRAWGTGPRDGSRFQQLDVDGDGFLSKDEAGTFLADRFDVIDADHDGRVSHDELRAGHPSTGRGMGWRGGQ